MKIFTIDDGKNGATIILGISYLCDGCFIRTKYGTAGYLNCVDINSHISNIFKNFNSTDGCDDISDYFSLCGKIGVILNKRYNITIPSLSIRFIVESELSPYVSKYIARNYENKNIV